MAETDEPALYIGVDGGASKTHVTVLDATGAVVGQAGGPASSLALSAAAAWRAIQTTIERAVPRARQTGHALHLGIGVAGTELSRARAEFEALLGGYASFQLVSDAHVACLGAHLNRDGAIVAAGTGMVGYRIASGTSVRVGGWGFPQDDRGSGAWIGLEAVNGALKAWDGRAAPGALATAIMARFGDPPNGLVAWASQAGAADFASLAREVAAHAETGEPLACAILQGAGDEISRLAATLVADCPQDMPVALVGGLAATLAPFVSDELAVRLVAPRAEASMGAALMAQESGGREAERNAG